MSSWRMWRRFGLLEWIIILSFTVGISGMSLGIAAFHKAERTYYSYFFCDPVREGVFEVEFPDPTNLLLDRIVSLTEEGVLAETYVSGSVVLQDKSFDLYGVYYVQEPSMKLFLAGGRGLAPEDMKSGRSVVIGEDVSRVCSLDIGDAVNIGDAEYEIVGMIRTSRDDMVRFRNAIFVPLVSGFSYLGPMYQGRVIASSRQDLIYLVENNSFDRLDGVVNSSVRKSVTDDQTGSRELLPLLILTGTILLVSSVNAAIIGTFWVKSKQREVAIRLAFGGSVRQVAKGIFQDMMRFWSAACLLSVVIHGIASVIYLCKGSDLPIGISINGLSMLIAGLFALGSCVPPLKHTFKITPREAFIKHE